MSLNQHIQRCFSLAEAERRGFASRYRLKKAIRDGKLLVRSGPGKKRVLLSKEDLIECFGDIDARIAFEVVGTGDLAKRWSMSVQAVHSRMKQDSEFPLYIGKINSGKIAVFRETDIRDYEAIRPELLSIPLRNYKIRVKGAAAGKLTYNGECGGRVAQINRRFSSGRSVCEWGYTTGTILRNTT